MTSLRINTDYRPNPDRGIFLSGVISQETLDRCTPLIFKLQVNSSSPITLYIDSPGGNTYHADVIQGLIKAKLQGQEAVRLITIATGTAASAAADLLISGDYALAYPHSIIHCHGIRMGQEEITHETAVNIARYLSGRNESYALNHAYKCIYRFIFRYLKVRSEFSDMRVNEPESTDVQCFVRFLQNHVEVSLQALLSEALRLSQESDELSEYLSAHQPRKSKTTAQFEANLFGRILDYELSLHKNDPQWSFLQSGFEKIEQKFKVLIDTQVGAHHRRKISGLCYQWKEFFLSSDQLKEWEQVEEEKQEEWLNQKIGKQLRPIWFLLVSIGRLLQKGEYRLSAEDAYWLGLIDEVIGREDLPSIRQIVEYADEKTEIETSD